MDDRDWSWEKKIGEILMVSLGGNCEQTDELVLGLKALVARYPEANEIHASAFMLGFVRGKKFSERKGVPAAALEPTPALLGQRAKKKGR